MADEQSASGSNIVGSVIEYVSDLGKPIVDKGLIERLRVSLARDAAAKTVLNGGYLGEPVVKSPHIERMLAAYRVATTGRVIVMYSPADSGKSVAAEFFMHGAHPYRPDRSLMLSAAGMKNFPEEYATLLGVKSVKLQLGAYLCNALVDQKPADSPSSAVELIGRAGDFVESSLCLMPEKRRLQHHISMVGEQVAPPRVDILKMPTLIIDNFNEATDENKKFVQQLLQSASAHKVFVFIMTTNKTWATTMVGLNGGSKIKPLYGNVRNQDYLLARSFTGVPDWNNLEWPVQTLRELIQPLCQKYGINAFDVVPDDAVMTPVEAKDAVMDRVFALSPGNP